MNEAYLQKIIQAKKNGRRTKRTISQLRKLRKGEVDGQIHNLHQKAFAEIDCLACANCCKTTGPLLVPKDISRMAHQLNISAQDFIDSYLKIDEDNDYIFKSMPCPFLGDDNYCTVYEFRPKACREYPHTDRVNQLGILKLTEKNAVICPAVAQIFESLDK